jgi:hypothetical protein
MSWSLTLRPTMSQSASRWPATASLRSSFCFRRTVSAARTATFSVCFGPPSGDAAPLFPGGAASLGMSSLMAATTFTPRRGLLPCWRWWNGARQSSFALRLLPGGGLARRRPVMRSMHGAAMSRDRSASDLRFWVASRKWRLVRWLASLRWSSSQQTTGFRRADRLKVEARVFFFIFASRQSGPSYCYRRHFTEAASFMSDDQRRSPVFSSETVLVTHGRHFQSRSQTGAADLHVGSRSVLDESPKRTC